MNLLPTHRCHDYRALLAIWRIVAREAGLRMTTLAEVEGEKIYWLETRARLSGPVIYISSGVHGDEPAAAWGLLAWAQDNIAILQQRPFILLPCLNPLGLIGNTRADHRGLDLNRRFHMKRDPICGPWWRMMKGRELGLGICLHEDYDAQGCYIYEVGLHRHAVAPDILKKCARRIPVDMRGRIDRWKAVNGVIRRRNVPPNLPGLPEAIVLHQLDCPLTLTFETPSEFGLDERVQTHVDFLNATLSLTVVSPETETEA